MIFRRDFRAAAAIALATSLACPPARALIALNDGRDRIYVSAGVSVARDSNVFANADHQGDFVYSTSLSADYTRRAGWIGVNGSASVGSSKFATIRGQDFVNPSVGLEFTKQSGRTTGSLSLSAARESRADAAVNTRSTSWHVPVSLSFKYPISGTYTLAGNLGYSSRKYVDETAFASLSTYQSSIDLFHILSTEREMSAGYRYRFSESSRHTSSTDHAITLGLSGKLIRGVNGGLRVGYQTRVPNGIPGESSYGSWTASASTSYALSRKLVFSGSLAKDFSTTATDSNVDTTMASLDARYAYSSRWSVSSNLTFGDSKFLGEAGRVILQLGPPIVLGPSRHDNYLSWNAALGFTLNEHLNAGLAYTWFRNWSTSSFADFVRSSWSLSLATRW